MVTSSMTRTPHRARAPRAGLTAVLTAGSLVLTALLAAVPATAVPATAFGPGHGGLTSSATSGANTGAAALVARTATATATPPATADAAGCTLSAKLVPSCGVLWGAAPAAYDFGDRLALTRTFESTQGRTLDVYHGYKTNGTLFPTATEIAISNDSTAKRLLLMNWRPGTDMTWKQIAAGSADGRIDKLAAYLKSTYNKPFFMAIWHEPEHFVKPTAGSGMEATDYRNMVRHVITRLKAQGATKVVFVQIYQGFPKYAATASWWPNLYPGDDVIDWIASDSYNSGKSSGYNSGDFTAMVNRTLYNTSWNGFYNWATTQHPGKPLMLGEWGVFYQSSDPSRQGWFFGNVQSLLSKYPAIKSMNYFNAAALDKGTTRVDATTSSRDAYRRLSASLSRINVAAVLG
jgi:hypothetical protein